MLSKNLKTPQEVNDTGNANDIFSCDWNCIVYHCFSIIPDCVYRDNLNSRALGQRYSSSFQYSQDFSEPLLGVLLRRRIVAL